MDRHRLIEILAIAFALARVITGAAVRARKRVLFHVLLPGCLVAAGLREVEPGLDVLASGTGMIAWRQKIHVDRSLPPRGAGPLPDRRFVDRRYIFRDQAHRGSPRWKRDATLCARRQRNDGHGPDTLRTMNQHPLDIGSRRWPGHEHGVLRFKKSAVLVGAVH